MTGSVAIVRAVDLARLYMRHGAEVFPVMSRAACKLMHPNLLAWATGNKAVTRLTGDIEHVALAGNVEDPVDAVVVAPATANTIGKIAAGIDDTPVTTLVTTAFGEGIPIILVPAMHEPMYRHPIVVENLEKLRRLGVRIVMPQVAEGKAKLASVEEVLAATVEALEPKRSPLASYRFVVTAGRTVEYIDPIRVLTNNSTGKMGVAVAAAARDAGAEVVLVFGKGTAEPPPGVTTIRVDTAQEMLEATLNAVPDGGASTIVVAAAAVGDWMPKETAKKKITTHGADTLRLDLVPTPKIIDRIKEHAPSSFLVAFRAQHGLSNQDLLADAANRMEKASADMIAANDVSQSGVGFETDTNELHVLFRDGPTRKISLGDKRVVAKELVAMIADSVAHRD